MNYYEDPRVKDQLKLNIDFIHRRLPCDHNLIVVMAKVNGKIAKGQFYVYEYDTKQIIYRTWEHYPYN